MPFFDF